MGEKACGKGTGFRGRRSDVGTGRQTCAHKAVRIHRAHGYTSHTHEHTASVWTRALALAQVNRRRRNTIHVYRASRALLDA
jgi:hypothetical protein